MNFDHVFKTNLQKQKWSMKLSNKECVYILTYLSGMCHDIYQMHNILRITGV